MSIAVLGVNHRTAPLEVRERFAHAAHEVPPALERVLRAGAGGGVLLSTCNRTEFYLAQPGGTVAEAVWELLSERLGGGGAAQEYGYVQRDRDAVRHLYRVSAGLDSMILGESQIQGQVREAWQVSRAQAGPVLHRLFQSALLVGARVRGETGLGVGTASAPSAAVALAGKVFGALAGRSAGSTSRSRGTSSRRSRSWKTSFSTTSLTCRRWRRRRRPSGAARSRRPSASWAKKWIGSGAGTTDWVSSP